MNQGEPHNLKSPKELEIERLSKFKSASWEEQQRRPAGVLLSDEIEYYCRKHQLIEPYSPDNLMAASYELRVGLKYAVGGKKYDVKLGDTVKIPQFEVAVIQILETINMPDFLIGRWNIRTRWAYEGLIWVGGPQVNPGFRGLLLCPIWNLSDKDIEIKCGDAIAVMDFEKTTPVSEKSNRRPHWDQRSRFVFEDYNADKLRSGLIAGAVETIKQLQKESTDRNKRVDTTLEQSRTRIDNVTAIMFTALGILTAAITLFATKPGTADQYWWDPTVFWLCSVTTVLALMAWLKSGSQGGWWWRIQLMVIVLAAVATCLQFFHISRQGEHAKNAEMQVQQLRLRIESLEHPKLPAEKPQVPLH